MLLIIHNLPTSVRYSDIKGLIKNRCNVEDFILDNLVYETTTQSRKITVGLNDESDAALVLKEFDGLVYMGKKLYVKDARKNKLLKEPQSSDQGFYTGNGNVNNMQNNIDLTQQTSPAVQNMFASPFYMTTNIPCDYQYNMPNYTENVNMPYSGGPTNYTTYQPSMVPHPSETQPDFIPFSNNKSLNELGVKNQSPPRYYKTNVSEQRPSDKIQGFNESSRGSCGWSDRKSSSRNDRGFNEPHNQSSYSGQRRYGGGNRSDEFSGRSGGSNNRPGEATCSNRNQNQSMNSNSQSYNRNYRQNPDGNKNDYNDKTDNNYRQLQNQTGNDGNRFNNKGYGFSSNSGFDTNKPPKNNQYKLSNFGGPMDKNPWQANSKSDNFVKNVSIQNKFSYNRDAGFQESRNRTNVPTQSGKYQKPATNKQNFNKKKNSSPVSLKDETWRNQAVSALVKDLLAVHQMEHLRHKPSFMPYIKSIVRSRVDNMLGKRVSVTLDQILEEYKNIYPVGIQKPFLTDAVNKFNREKDYKETKPKGIHVAMDTAAAKRKIEETVQLKPGNVKKFKKQEQQIKIVPGKSSKPAKNHNSIKKEFQQLKKQAQDEFEGDVVYKLEPKLQQALDEEVKIMVDLFNEECQKNDGAEEAKVCQRIMKVSEKFKKVLTLDVTKRILKITCNLLVRVYPHPRIKWRDLPPLTHLGVVNIRKSARAKFFVAMCDSYSSYDRLCSTEKVQMDGYYLSFKPLHVAGPKPKRKKFDKKKGNEDEDSADDDSDGDEGGADDEDYGDEEDDDDGEVEEIDDERNGDEEIAIKIGDEKETALMDIPKDITADKNALMITELNEETPVNIESSEKCNENITEKTNEGEVPEPKVQDNENNQEATNTITETQCVDVADIAQDDLEDF